LAVLGQSLGKMATFETSLKIRGQ